MEHDGHERRGSFIIKASDLFFSPCLLFSFIFFQKLIVFPSSVLHLSLSVMEFHAGSCLCIPSLHSSLSSLIPVPSPQLQTHFCLLSFFLHLPYPLFISLLQILFAIHSPSALSIYLYHLRPRTLFLFSQSQLYSKPSSHILISLCLVFSFHISIKEDPDP